MLRGRMFSECKKKDNRRRCLSCSTPALNSVECSTHWTPIPMWSMEFGLQIAITTTIQLIDGIRAIRRDSPSEPIRKRPSWSLSCSTNVNSLPTRPATVALCISRHPLQGSSFASAQLKQLKVRKDTAKNSQFLSTTASKKDNKTTREALCTTIFWRGSSEDLLKVHRSSSKGA